MYLKSMQQIFMKYNIDRIVFDRKRKGPKLGEAIMMNFYSQDAQNEQDGARILFRIKSMIIYESKLIFYDDKANLYEIPFEQRDKQAFFSRNFHDIEKIVFYKKVSDITSDTVEENVPENYYLVKRRGKDTVYKVEAEKALRLVPLGPNQSQLDELER